MNAYKEDKSFDDMKTLSNHSGIVDSVELCNWNEDQKKKALIAAVYFQAVKNSKGENALYLERQLRDNLAKGDNKESLVVPQFIVDAINFITS